MSNEVRTKDISDVLAIFVKVLSVPLYEEKVFCEGTEPMLKRFALCS